MITSRHWPWVQAALLALFGLAGYAVDSANNARHAEKVRAAAKDHLAHLRGRLEGHLYADLHIVQGLRGLVALKPDISQEEFAIAAAPLFQKQSHLRNLGLAPDMGISRVYPVSGNEAVLGRNYQDLPGQFVAADRARRIQRLVLAGPLNLAQGGEGLVSRLPVYLPGAAGREHFWGLVFAVIDTTKLFQDSGLLEPAAPFEIALRGRDAGGPEGAVFLGRAELFEERPVVADIALPDGSWRLAAAPREGWPARADNAGELRLGFLLAAVLVFLISHALGRAIRNGEEARRRADLEKTRLAATLENTPDVAVQWFDRQGRILFWNRASERIFGWTAAEAQNGEINESLLSPEDTREFLDDLEHVAASGASVGPREYTVRHRDGSSRQVHSTLFSIPGEAGQPYLVCMDVDITRRKQAEEEIRRYQFIANTVTDMMSVINREHRYEAVNDQWCQVLRRNRQNSVGLHVSEVWGQDAYRRAILRPLSRCFREGEVVVVPTSLKLGEANAREYEISYLPYKDAPGEVTHVVVVTRDRTEKLAAERELVRAKEVAETASLAKSSFLASMGQELRRPLNSIIGLARILELDTAAPLTAAQRESINHILMEGRHLLTLIREVQDLAGIEMGRLELKIEAVHLPSLIAEALDESRVEAESRQVALNYAVAGCEACPPVRADASRLRQVLRNLLANAILCNHPQGCVAVSCEARGEWVRITVTDTGPGIPELMRGRVFQPFQRLGRDHAGSDGGGVGPVFSKRMVEAMQGRMGYDSEVGVGSYFWFELHGVNASGPAQPEPPNPPAAPTLQGKRVLYVEDSPINLDLMKHVFSLLPGVELLVAPDGETALAILARSAPDLVLLDINLPGINGLEVLRRMRERPENAGIPAIAVSAVAMPHEVKAGLESGLMDYLTKPFEVQTLLQRVREALAKSTRNQDAGEGRV